MRVLVVTIEFPPYIPEYSRTISNLYREIERLGHEVTIPAGKAMDAELIRADSSGHDCYVRFLGYPTISASHLQFPLRAYLELKRLHFDKYDVLFSHTELPFQITYPPCERLTTARRRATAIERLLEQY